MNLTVEVLDHDTLSWRMLACHEDIALDAAPAVVAILRNALPAAATLRWAWSRSQRAERAETGRGGKSRARWPFQRRRQA